jgi:hypothetical protein
MLAPRAIAMQGVGFGANFMAVQGFAIFASQADTTPSGWSGGASRRHSTRHLPTTRPKRSRTTREHGDILFL